MRIAVISDLHIGAPDIDLLGHDTNSFIGFLKNLEQSFNKIILLGDIIETLMPSKPNGYEEAFYEAWEHRKEITKRFECPQYTYIFGNHDWIAQKTIGAPEKLSLLYEEKYIVFTHGHQIDRFYHAKLIESLLFGMGWFVRRGLKKTYSHLASLESMRSGRDFFLKNDIKRYAKNHSADIVVMSHTHIPTIQSFDKVQYLNSGFGAFGGRMFLSMDLRKEDYSIQSW